MKSTSSIGFEAELFLIDSNGEIKPKADEILKLGGNLRHKPVGEYAKEVIEINAYPSEIVEGAIIDYINTFYEIDEIIKKENLYLLPMSVYPGDYSPVVREDTYYKVKEKIIGKERMENAARCIGFHFHYPLPNDPVKITQLHNFFISITPIFDLFMQSSPFYKGKQLGKTTRAFAYRDMKTEEIEGVYYNSSLFGGMPSYEKNFSTLLYTMKMRNLEWLKRIVSSGFSKEEANYKTGIHYYWGTVRLNPKVATIELRSPDVNLPSILLEGMHLFRKMCDGAMELNISISEEDLFFVESDTLYLPSISSVRKAVYESSLKGFESEFSLSYANSLLKVFGLDSYTEIFKGMIENKKSFSDELIEKAKSLGFEEKLTKEQSNELSLFVAERMVKEIDLVKSKALSLFSEFKPLNLAISSELMSKILENIAEEENKIDLSRSSLGRLGNIKAVVFSPNIFEMEEVKNNPDAFIKSLLKLSKSFIIVLLTHKDASLPLKEKLKSMESNINFIEIPSSESEKALKGLIKLWAEASSIPLTHILYLGLKEDEKELMSYFGASATLNNSQVKDSADILIEKIDELPLFIGKNKL